LERSYYVQTVAGVHAKMSGLKDKPRWVKKMKVFFHLAMDVNKKGYMTKDDWLAVVDRIAEKNGYDVQSEPKGDCFTHEF